MTDLQTPNTDPANEGSLGGITREVLEAWLRDSVDGMLPAEVLGYDDARNRARVRPIISIRRTDGTAKPRGEVASVPVFRFGGGGFFMRFKLAPGDKGWILAADRDISLFLQTGADHPPPSRRFHSFSQGLFLPDTFRDWSADSAAGVVLQSMDGQVALELHADKIVQRVGASTITTTAAAVDIVSPALRHNGVNVGATHTHTATQPGEGTSGVPVP